MRLHIVANIYIKLISAQMSQYDIFPLSPFPVFSPRQYYNQHYINSWISLERDFYREIPAIRITLVDIINISDENYIIVAWVNPSLVICCPVVYSNSDDVDSGLFARHTRRN